MYQAKNKKIKIVKTGKRYELFLTPDNAEHIIARENNEAHQLTLKQAVTLAYNAHYFEWAQYDKPHPYSLVYGLVLYRDKPYQVVGYINELNGGRFILETVRVASEQHIRAIADTIREQLTTVSFSPDGKITLQRTPPSK